MSTDTQTKKDVDSSQIDTRFFLTYQEEPHKTRRMEIIAKYPEVTKLVGPEPKTKWIVLGVVTLQFACAYFMRDVSMKNPIFWITAYFIGATCISNVFLAIHEFCHNLAFKKPLYNRLFGIVANLPVGVPYSASFGPYHLLHHKHMGEPDFDTDLPTKLEALVLSNVLGKAFFATFQLFFYALRPVFLIQLPFTWVHFLNVVVQFTADYIIVNTLGWQSYYYLLCSSFLAGSLHPIAGHFIAEHYLLDPPTKKSPDLLYPETFSYYGWMNIFVYNAGYHSEHHDFPYIAWSKLPILHDIASDFYKPLPYHTSWAGVIVEFIFNQKVTLWNRVKRPSSLKNRQKLMSSLHDSS